MSKVVAEFSLEKRAGGFGGQKYPWDEWLDGQIHVLDNEDFGDVKLDSFATSVRDNAKKRGLAVEIRTDKENRVMEIRAFEKPAGTNGEATEVQEAPAPTPTKKGGKRS